MPFTLLALSINNLNTTLCPTKEKPQRKKKFLLFTLLAMSKLHDNVLASVEKLTTLKAHPMGYKGLAALYYWQCPLKRFS